jgi:alcohol dehydrogenase class IV
MLPKLAQDAIEEISILFNPKKPTLEDVLRLFELAY